MSSEATSERIAALLKQADEDVKASNLPKASRALKEASQLDSEDAKVKEAWAALQKREQSGDFSNLLDSYLVGHDEDVGKTALEALGRKPLSPEQSTQALNTLLGASTELAGLDALTAALLAHSLDAKKELASKMTGDVVEIYEQFYIRGNGSMRALAALPLEDGVWSSRDVQKAAQKDVFQLSLAKLIEADVSFPERAMRVVARQLAIAPGNLTDFLDESSFDVLLENLDVRKDTVLRSQALLACSKMLEVTKEKGEGLFRHFITKAVAQQTNDDLIIAFSAAAALFPVIPAVAAKMFMTDGFVQQLVPNLERNSEAAASGQRKSRTLEKAALELLSAACVDKACRGAIERYCASWLRNLSEDREGTQKALAALILAKINATAQSEITGKLTDLVLTGDSERDEAVEGLAYTSLQPKIKEEIVANLQLLERLVKALNERPNAIFGCLTIFSNLTMYRIKETEEQKKMSQLKAYANSSKPTPDDPLDNDAHVTVRAKELLDAGVVPALLSCCKQTSSMANVALIVNILLSLSKDQKSRSKLAQQGAIKLLLQIRDRISQTDKATPGTSAIERTAAHALARLLISVNPAHVFSSALPASSAVSALTPLLSYDHASSDNSPRDLLPTFETILALTNLASMDDDSTRDLLIRTSFAALEDLLFSSTTLVQRASVELVCNLVVSPQGVAKFADGSADAKRRMRILLALADVEDAATRRAAGGALAMLTEWDAAVATVLEKENGAKALLGLCEDESEELRHRGLVCVLNVVSAPQEVGESGLKAVKEAGGKEVVQDCLRKSKEREVLEIGVEVLKKLQ